MSVFEHDRISKINLQYKLQNNNITIIYVIKHKKCRYYIHRYIFAKISDDKQINTFVIDSV